MVDGRMVDSFILPDGRIIHPSSLTIPLENIPGIWRFQIRQEKKDLVRMLLVTTDSFKQNARSCDRTDLCRQITAGLRKTLGDSVQIIVDIVDDIPQPADPRHKLQAVVSMVNRQISA
jgi:phenylacetate-coenzyme A ligase PaaK-like adenylate-forming protein